MSLHRAHHRLETTAIVLFNSKNSMEANALETDYKTGNIRTDHFSTTPP
jgi:hypothetical protein